MAAYRADIDRLVAERGFRTRRRGQHRARQPGARGRCARKFLDEHFHKEDEVRFFVAGSGLFTLHVDGTRLRDPVRTGRPDRGAGFDARTGSTWVRSRASSRSASSPSPTAGSAISPAPTSRRNSRATSRGKPADGDDRSSPTSKAPPAASPSSRTCCSRTRAAHCRASCASTAATRRCAAGWTRSRPRTAASAATTSSSRRCRAGSTRTASTPRSRRCRA